MQLAANATDDEMLALVERWIDDLSRGDYAAAYARTSHDPYYEWTPELIHAVIAGYGLPEPHRRGPFSVTDRLSAHGTPRYEIDREDLGPGTVAEVWYDLPLNGEWSDLTATFRFERDGDFLRAVLQEIHVF
jgi:hypothetical protein